MRWSFVSNQNISIFVIVFIIGTIVGTLGTISFPGEVNMGYFWPAATIQSVSGVLFGIWGALASALFPSLSNAMTGGTSIHVMWLIPSNIIQSFLPLMVQRITKFDLSELTVKNILIFIVGCVIIPNIIGSVFGCSILLLAGKIPDVAHLINAVKIWLIGNIPFAVIFGPLILRSLTPALKSCNLYYGKQN